MAGSEWARELRLLEELKTQAWVEGAANRMVGELLSEGHCLQGTAPEGEPEFADRLIRCELGLIADGVYPIRVALRVALLRAVHEVLKEALAIRALPESTASAPPAAPAVRGRGKRRASVRNPRNGAAPRKG